MRLPNSVHTARPWRIHELTRGFRLEDVWALPTPGGSEQFPRLVEQYASVERSPAGSSRLAQTLWAMQWGLGAPFGWDDPIPGAGDPTLRDRLPADLRAARSGPAFAALPYTPLYLLEDEFAAEIVNRTVHGILHLGWVPTGSGAYRGEMAVYVRPIGLLGRAYMAAIRPLRYLVVYPALMRQTEGQWRSTTSSPARADRRGSALPPGQRVVRGFPRFGTHLHEPAPRIPAHPVIEVAGAVTHDFAVPLAEFGSLPRRELTADFHCVAGWSATGLRWAGVAFGTFFRRLIEPSLTPGVAVTHVVFEGLDGYRSVVLPEDALREDVLIADQLDGQSLESDHGAPVRLVSPSQYGFISTKHLCRIEVHTTKPAERVTIVDRLLSSHPRARVWREERHGHLPAGAVRGLYRLLIRPIAWLSARGSAARTARVTGGETP